ncbi:MAG: FIMAH domain-containing protein, partial [Planctomycetota bacterium]
QIQNILDFLDASVAEGSLLGYGPGNSASKRLKALRNMIESASDLIDAGDYAHAVDQLESVAKKTDDVAKPQDFVVGEATSTLNTMINELIADLAS